MLCQLLLCDALKLFSGANEIALPSVVSVFEAQELTFITRALDMLSGLLILTVGEFGNLLRVWGDFEWLISVLTLSSID